MIAISMTPFVGITVKCLASSCFSASFGADSCDSAATCMSMTPHAQKASPQALVHDESAIHQSNMGEKTCSTRCPCRNLNTPGAANLHVCISGSRSCVIQAWLNTSFPVISFHPVMLLLNRQMMSPNESQLPHDRLHKFLRASPGASAGIAISLVLLTCTFAIKSESRGKGQKRAWQGAWHENTRMLRMQMLPNLLPVVKYEVSCDWRFEPPQYLANARGTSASSS